MDNILVTGGLGVIGTPLVRQFREIGLRVRVFDVATTPTSDEFGDIQELNLVQERLDGVGGIVHLAAVSRVRWAEEAPQRCRSINIDGTHNVVQAALSARRQPWVLFISSREVYGNPARLPVTEDDPISPVNTYGRSKAEGERIIAAAREAGLATACVRLPSIYGATNDIPDRVVPAFARAACENSVLRITGAEQVCDFVHVADAVRGLLEVTRKLNDGARELETVHLASGRGISLGELARLSTRLSGSRSEIIEEPARTFDVRGFVGDPARARAMLGWVPRIEFEQGLLELIQFYKAERASAAGGSGRERT